ncbi:hypothetical protein [Swaminathania salitolerans]|nr:hypothetical protein [Swaminathania salitolerans]
MALAFMLLSLMFPMPWMLRKAPWLGHVPGMQRPTSPAGQDAASSRDDGPSTPGSGAAQSQADNGTDRLMTPDITRQIVGSIAFGGHTLPLPAGIWHPVLTGQYGPGGQMLINILVRTDRGIVTGVTIARTADAQLPVEIVQEASGRCHDDRNYAAHVFADRADGRSECAFVANAVMGPNGVISPDELIQLAFRRLSALGFPLPSLFIVASWIRSSGATDSEKGTSAVTYLLSPTNAGTVQLLAPLPYWDKETLSQAPAARAFVQKTDQWFEKWIPLLRRDMTRETSNAAIPETLARDPAAPT